MSDHWICIIPRDPYFLPSAAAITDAETLFAKLAPHANEITREIADTVIFRDCGANFETIRCPECQTEVSSKWWGDEMGAAWDSGFQLCPLRLPCGHTASSLNELHYDFEQGFSRFSLEAMNPSIGTLTTDQIDRFEEILGCPIKVIYRHI